MNVTVQLMSILGSLPSTPGNSARQGSLACCSPWGREEEDMTEWLNSNNHQLREGQTQVMLKTLSQPSWGSCRFMSQPKRLTFSWFQGISSVHHLFLQPPTSPRRIHTLLFILGWPKHLFRFSVPSYSKTRMNVLANPIHLHPLDATLPMYW